MTFSSTSNSLSHLWVVSFRVFDTDIVVFTDDPDAASLSPRCSFGVEPGVSFHESAPAAGTPFLALVKDSGRAAALIDELAAAERLRVGLGAPDMAWDASRGAAVAVLDGPPPQRAHTAITAAAFFVRLLLKSRGVFFIHASCVAHDGAAALIAGENETGKSSLAHALALSGMSLAADDNLPICADTDAVRAMYVREAFNAANMDAGQVQSLLGRGFSRAHVPGFLLPPSALEPVPARAVFFPYWAEKDTPPQPVSGAFALKALYAACKTPLAGDDIKVYDAIVARLLEQAVCLRVGLERRPGRGASTYTVAGIMEFLNSMPREIDA